VEQRAYLQSPFYLFLQSTTCLVTLVAEKVTGDKSSKIFPQIVLLVTRRSLTSQLVTCHTSRFLKQVPGVPFVGRRVPVCLRGLSHFVLGPTPDLFCQPIIIGNYMALV